MSRGPYTDIEVQHLADVIRGKRNPHVVNVGLLEELLNQWLIGNDLTDLSLFPGIPAAHDDHDLPDVRSNLSHREIANSLRKIASLSEQLSGELTSSAQVSALNATIRRLLTGKKPTIKGNAAIKAAGEEMFLIRDFKERLAVLIKASAQLAQYHASHSPRGRPKNLELSNLLYELAHVYVAAAGLDHFIEQLPRSENSRFIAFAREVLSPFFDATETTPKALARRFARDNPIWE